MGKRGTKMTSVGYPINNLKRPVKIKCLLSNKIILTEFQKSVTKDNPLKSENRIHLARLFWKKHFYFFFSKL